MSFEDWRAFDGLETVLSYGADALSAQQTGSLRRELHGERTPQAHLRFMSVLEDVCAVGRYSFVHASLRPGIPIECQRTEDLACIREDLSFPSNFGFIMVPGHTPVGARFFLPNQINIDTGACATNRLCSRGRRRDRS